MLVLSLFCMSIGYSNAWKVTGNIVLTAFPRQQQINNRNYKCNVRVYKPRLLKGLNFNGAFSFFLMIWMVKVPWRHAATAYLWERVCVCINFLLYSLCWGMCLHTLSTFCRPSAVTLCPCVRLCVCIQRSGEPGLFSCSFLIMGVYTF